MSTSFGIESSNLVAVMRDRASVNSVAMRILSLVYPTMLEVGCFSHTIDHVGEKFEIPVLDKFVKHGLLGKHSVEDLCQHIQKRGGGADGRS